MLTFKGNRKLDDIIAIMQEKNMEVDMKQFNEGGDYILFCGFWSSLLVTIIFNTFNGKFQIWDRIKNEKLADESSIEFDNEEWYINLLNTLYEAV